MSNGKENLDALNRVLALGSVLTMRGADREDVAAFAEALLKDDMQTAFTLKNRIQNCDVFGMGPSLKHISEFMDAVLATKPEPKQPSPYSGDAKGNKTGRKHPSKAGPLPVPVPV